LKTFISLSKTFYRRKQLQFKKKTVPLPKIYQICYVQIKVRELQESKQMLQRHISAAFGMDNAGQFHDIYGDRRAEREQVPAIAGISQTAHEGLLTLWFACQVAEVVADEKGLLNKVLNVAKHNFKQ
jgi:hypothetical protein